MPPVDGWEQPFKGKKKILYRVKPSTIINFSIHIVKMLGYVSASYFKLLFLNLL